VPRWPFHSFPRSSLLFSVLVHPPRLFKQLEQASHTPLTYSFFFPFGKDGPDRTELSSLPLRLLLVHLRLLLCISDSPLTSIDCVSKAREQVNVPRDRYAHPEDHYVRILRFRSSFSCYAPLTLFALSDLSGVGTFIQKCTITLTPTVVDGVDMVREEESCTLTPDNGNGGVSGARTSFLPFEQFLSMLTLCS